jgi:HSP20 family protein
MDPGRHVACTQDGFPSRHDEDDPKKQKEQEPMSLIPWRREEGTTAVQSDFDDLWKTDFWRNFWEPFNGTRSRLPALFQGRNYPPMNVSESENHFLVTLELPGLDVKDITIEVMGNQLQVTGERKWEEEKKGKEFHRVESQYGSFCRSLALPENARMDRESIEATFRNGILEVKVPKVEPTPAAKIAIKTK